MDFWDNTLSILAGVVLGFGLSIVAFPVQNWLRERSIRKSLETNVKREFDFNESFLEEKIDDLQSTIDYVSAGSRVFFCYLNYSSYMRHFLDRYFDQGYLFKNLEDNEDIKLLNSIVNVMSLAGESYVNNIIQMWKNQAMTKDQAVEALSFQRDQLRRFLKGLKRIKKAIVPK
ncbi:MAG: hypothetical protein KAT85_12165 [candidate division Zixibacteria bacterium]|nr:hypothetical protein [candidate division Zixibacteria bacterium]